MSNPVSKEEKKRRILAALEGRAQPVDDLPPAAQQPERSGAAKSGNLKSAQNIAGMMDRSPRATTKVIGDFVDQNPDRALAVFRSWMAE